MADRREVNDALNAERGGSSTRVTMIEVATRLFGERGYPGTSIRDIAEIVGILPGSLYAHIGNKEEMLLEIVSSGIDRFLEVVGASSREADPRERLKAMIRAHLSVVAANPQSAQVVFHQWRYLSEANQLLVRKKRRAYERLFRDVIIDGAVDGTLETELDLRIAVLVVLGSLNWSAEWLVAGSNVDDGTAEAFSNVILDGLAAAKFAKETRRRG